MGACFFGDVQYGDDGRDAGPMDFAPCPKPLATSVLDEIDFSPARRLATHLCKNAARRYIKTPAFLDNISHGLSASSPKRILAVCDHKAEFGGNPFGALVLPVNLAGARLYARWLRRHEMHDAALDAQAERDLREVA